MRMATNFTFISPDTARLAAIAAKYGIFFDGVPPPDASSINRQPVIDRHAIDQGSSSMAPQ